MESYYDWRFLLLSSIIALLCPVIAIVGAKPEFSKQLFRTFLMLILPLALCFALPWSISVGGSQLFARLVTPLSLFVLFLPFIIRNIHRIIIISLVIISVFSAIQFRSNIAWIGMALVIALLFYLLKNPAVRLLELIRKILFFLPILLFILGVTGVFNVFKFNDYVSWSPDTESEEFNDKLKVDTRTFLYSEVISSVIKHNKITFGESAVGKHETLYFKYTYNKQGGDRYATETGILNIFLFGGVIAVLLYGILFYYASWVAVCKSRNNISKAIGVFLAFRWLWMFVEEFTNYNMNYFFLWLLVGLCLSKTFRNMTNAEAKAWINNIFYRKDRYYVEDSSANDRA